MPTASRRHVLGFVTTEVLSYGGSSSLIPRCLTVQLMSFRQNRAHPSLISLSGQIKAVSDGVSAIMGIVIFCHHVSTEDANRHVTALIPSPTLASLDGDLRYESEWMASGSRNGRHILGRLPSSVHGWKRSFIFVYCPSGWPFPTKWSDIDVRSKAFGSPRLRASELSDIAFLKEVEPPNLIEPSAKLFELIDEAMADKGASTAPGRKGMSLAEKSKNRVFSREKKTVLRPEKRPREVGIAPPMDSSVTAPEQSSASIPTAEEGSAKRPRQPTSSLVPTPSASTQAPLLLDPVEWGRQALPAELKVKRLSCDKHVAEAEELVASKKAHRLKVEEEAKKRESDLQLALASEKEALQAIEKALKALIIEEREKAKEEYCDSDELQDEVAGLFKEVYNTCLDKVRGLHPGLDFSGVALPDEGDDGAVERGIGDHDEEVAAVVDETVGIAIDRSLDKVADDVMAEDPSTLKISGEVFRELFLACSGGGFSQNFFVLVSVLLPSGLRCIVGWPCVLLLSCCLKVECAVGWLVRSGGLSQNGVLVVWWRFSQNCLAFVASQCVALTTCCGRADALCGAPLKSQHVVVLFEARDLPCVFSSWWVSGRESLWLAPCRFGAVGATMCTTPGGSGACGCAVCLCLCALTTVSLSDHEEGLGETKCCVRLVVTFWFRRRRPYGRILISEFLAEVCVPRLADGPAKCSRRGVVHAYACWACLGNKPAVSFACCVYRAYSLFARCLALEGMSVVEVSPLPGPPVPPPVEGVLQAAGELEVRLWQEPVAGKQRSGRYVLFLAASGGGLVALVVTTFLSRCFQVFLVALACTVGGIVLAPDCSLGLMEVCGGRVCGETFFSRGCSVSFVLTSVCMPSIPHGGLGWRCVPRVASTWFLTPLVLRESCLANLVVGRGVTLFRYFVVLCSRVVCFHFSLEFLLLWMVFGSVGGSATFRVPSGPGEVWFPQSRGVLVSGCYCVALWMSILLCCATFGLDCCVHSTCLPLVKFPFVLPCQCALANGYLVSVVGVRLAVPLMGVLALCCYFLFRVRERPVACILPLLSVGRSGWWCSAMVFGVVLCTVATFVAKVSCGESFLLACVVSAAGEPVLHFA
ncbi:hypothetical protein Taro_053718 [Colocasia esculenta]|uniref:Uncharacterized protein n=1 Tax=Colocasia esculenta TaxID=4460 RepID=A0A843XLW7_COLES|nr:hypothetical protein [Colocasia esculenta]